MRMLDPAETRRRYDESASHYNPRYCGIQRSKYPLLLHLISPAQGHRVLDWGCGTGLAREAMEDHGARYVGIDFSKGMLCHMNNRDRSMVVLGDCTRLPFRPGSFDCLLGATVLQNIDRGAEALREVSRVLRAGGRAAISYPRRMAVGLDGIRPAGLLLTREIECGEDAAVRLEKADKDKEDKEAR